MILLFISHNYYQTSLYMNVFYWIINDHMSVNNYWCFYDSHNLFTSLIDNRIVYFDNTYCPLNGDVTITLPSFITFLLSVHIQTASSLFNRVGKPKTTAKLIEKSINKRLSYTS